jgi:hypothetical protein
MPQTQDRLFVVTASNPDAKRHVDQTVAHSIDPGICAAHFPPSVLDEVKRKSTDVCLAKTSCTSKMNDLVKSSIWTVPIRSCHDRVAPASPRLDGQRF